MCVYVFIHGLIYMHVCVYVCVCNITYTGYLIFLCPFSSPTFLTNCCDLKKNRTRVDRARNIAAFPTIMAHVELMVGRRTHFFTSIPYASDQLSSTCRVTLHGGFNRQAARVTRNSFTRALALLFLFLIDFYSDLIPANYFPHSLSQNNFYTFMNTHERFVPSCLRIIYLLFIYILNFLK